MTDRILITGGAGFVGAHLAVALKERNQHRQVVVLDNLHRRGSELNLDRLQRHGIRFVHGDVRNPEDLREAGSADLIIECSAEPSVLAGFTSGPEYAINSNLLGALNCFEHARNDGADVVFLSTSRVYPIGTLCALEYEEGDSRFELKEQQPAPGVTVHGIAEDFPLEGPRSIYGATKLCAELMLQEYVHAYGIRAVINRCGLITGPGQMARSDQGVVALWVASHVFGQPLKYIGYGGSGKQVRDMLHVADLVALIESQLENLSAHSGKVYNVGGGQPVSASLLELTRICQEVTGQEVPVQPESRGRQADIPIFITDSRKVSEAANWSPQHRVDRIVSDIYQWIRDNQEALRPILFPE